MGDDVSGDDADDDDDDEEAEPLDEGDDPTALAALSLAAAEVSFRFGIFQCLHYCNYQGAAAA
jgi:hypothetical protein